MDPLKNWDNKTWLSSKEYINHVSKFILKQKKLNKHSRILDIGCGRGKIIGDLSNKLRLINKPIGIDIINHRDKSKKIIFKKSDGFKFVSKTKVNFDLIIIKQSIHFLKKKKILNLLTNCQNKLNLYGKIVILSLDTDSNEIPTFKLMKKKLEKSLKQDKKIFKSIIKNYSKVVIKRFIFNVKIIKNKYLKMIRNRYISTLLNLNNKQIEIGINEINSNYSKEITFKDKLVCIIIKK